MLQHPVVSYTYSLQSTSSYGQFPFLFKREGFIPDLKSSLRLLTIVPHNNFDFRSTLILFTQKSSDDLSVKNYIGVGVEVENIIFFKLQMTDN